MAIDSPPNNWGFYIRGSNCIPFSPSSGQLCKLRDPRDDAKDDDTGGPELCWECSMILIVFKPFS